MSFSLRPHECNTFNTASERFITVIKVLFSNTLPHKVSPHNHSKGSTETKARCSSAAVRNWWLAVLSIFIEVDITSLDNQLQQIAREKQIASFKHEND